MLNNPYRKAVNIGGAALGLATLVATGVAANRVGPSQVDLAAAPNPGLHDGVYRVETECADAPFCPIRTMAIDVAGGQIVSVDVAYHNQNRQSHARNTSAVQSLTTAAIERQSADGLDMVSGATVTSQMFTESLQAAIALARG